MKFVLVCVLAISLPSFADCNFKANKLSSKNVFVSDTAFVNAYTYFDGTSMRAIDYSTCKEAASIRLPNPVLDILNASQYASVSSYSNLISSTGERYWLISTPSYSTKSCSTYVFKGESEIIAAKGQYAFSIPDKFIALNASCANDSVIYVFSLPRNKQGVAPRSALSAPKLSVIQSAGGVVITANESGNLYIYNPEGTTVYASKIASSKPVSVDIKGGATYLVKFVSANGTSDAVSVVIPQ